MGGGGEYKHYVPVVFRGRAVQVDSINVYNPC
jgi:hypothetical protein